MYRKSLELDPGSAAAHYNLAAYLARRDEYAEAERHFRAALARNPDARTYGGLGLVLWKQGRSEAAIAFPSISVAAAGGAGVASELRVRTPMPSGTSGAAIGVLTVAVLTPA